MSKERSDCCNAPVTTKIIDKGTTNYYICLNCKEDCNLKDTEDKDE